MREGFIYCRGQNLAVCEAASKIRTGFLVFRSKKGKNDPQASMGYQHGPGLFVCK